MIISLILLISFLSFLFKIDILLSVYLSSLAIPLLSKFANKKTQNFKNRANPWPNFPKIQTLRKFSKKPTAPGVPKHSATTQCVVYFNQHKRKQIFEKSKLTFFLPQNFQNFSNITNKLWKIKNRADPWPNFLKKPTLKKFLNSQSKKNYQK